MSISATLSLVQREYLDALRNKWWMVYSIAFVALCLGLATMIVNSTGYTGISGFGRTAAGLINLVLFLSPLMGLTLGAQALASEREQGTLAYFLAQPVSFAEIFLAKFIGMALATGGAVTLGFSLSSLAILWWSGGTGIEVFLKLLPLTLLLTWATLAIGMLISSRTDKTVTALGTAVVAWLFLVLISSLGLMGTAIVVGLSPGALLAVALVNPLEAFRVAAVLQMRGSLELLGPAGLVASDRFGDATSLLLIAILLVWLCGGLALAFILSRRKDLQ